VAYTVCTWSPVSGHLRAKISQTRDSSPVLAAVIERTATKQSLSCWNWSQRFCRALAGVLPSIRMKLYFCGMARTKDMTVKCWTVRKGLRVHCFTLQFCQIQTGVKPVNNVWVRQYITEIWEAVKESGLSKLRKLSPDVCRARKKFSYSRARLITTGT